MNIIASSWRKCKEKIQSIHMRMEPSSCAASSKSIGIEFAKNVRAIMILLILTQLGKMTDHMLSSNPRSRIIRYEGIRPPLKNMVNTRSPVTTPRPGKSLLDSA